MKIALMMENSQAAKNASVLKELKTVADEKSYSVYNVGMSDEQDHHLTYIHLGIMASILLNAKAVDFVVTGCGTGQCALISLKIHPRVALKEVRAIRRIAKSHRCATLEFLIRSKPPW